MVVAILSNSSPGNKLRLLICHNGLQIWAPTYSAFTRRACTDGQGGESHGTSGIYSASPGHALQQGHLVLLIAIPSPKNVSSCHLSSQKNAQRGVQVSLFRWNHLLLQSGKGNSDWGFPALPESFSLNLQPEPRQHVARLSLPKRHHGTWNLNSYFSASWTSCTT